jgi:HlyD family secretion protein
LLKKIVLAVVLLAAAIAGAWWYRKNAEPPSVAFSQVQRGRMANTLATNGKVEPSEFVEVRADASGMIRRLGAKLGDSVSKGQVLAEISQPGQSDDLAAAEARVAALQAELTTLQAGGRPAEFAEIDGALARLREQREVARKNRESLERLVKNNAATRFEADQAAQLEADLSAQMRALEQKRPVLVPKGDVEAARARIREAETAVAQIRTRIGQNTVRSELSGVLFDLPVRVGGFLNPGDIVGSVGRMDPVTVKVFVDEPEMGRLKLGQPVRITWDALAGKDWTGTVGKLPSQVVALGSRQVGETLCSIANPGGTLTPGTNVNAFILTQVVESALTIPKAAVRREKGTGVWVLDRAAGVVRWRGVQTGASDALRVQVVSGLSDSDFVAQPPADLILAEGMRVTPAMVQTN